MKRNNLINSLGTINKINEDLEMIKSAVNEIRVAIHLEPELREEIKQQVAEARERISRGDFVSNEDILKEFELGWAIALIGIKNFGYL